MRWDQLLLENIVDIDQLKRRVAEYFKCESSSVLVATSPPTGQDCRYDVFIVIALMHKGHKMQLTFLFSALDPMLDDGIACATWLASSFGCSTMIELPDPEHLDKVLVLHPNGTSMVAYLDEELRDADPPFFVIATASD
jgi:hypothetical protein